MITPVTMHDTICDFLEKYVALKYPKLKTVDRKGNENFKSPQVVRSGFILPKSIDDDISEEEEFPFIIPRIEKVSNKSNEIHSTVKLSILFGIYAPANYDEKGIFIDDGGGYRDLWNIIETTRQAFLSTHTIDKKYSVHKDYFESEMIEEQIYPYWQGYCEFKLDVAFPLPELDEFFF